MHGMDASGTDVFSSASRCKPWMQDIDAPIAPLHARKKGAEQGDKPAKSMQSSYVLHTPRESNLGLTLNVLISSGKQHPSMHTRAAQVRLLGELDGKRLRMFRGHRGRATERSCWI
ncbi:MAG: hypothetical protein K2W33_16190 [Burkholderiales bacterium]|nr:hypothetical protein [Burkholderiales bacterium]